LASLPWGAAAQEESEPIVVEVPESEAEPFDVLDDQVGALGRRVRQPGAVPAQERDLPTGDRAGEAFELGHVAAIAVLVEGDEPPAGLEGVGREVGLAQQFLSEVGGADLALGVAGIQPGEDTGEAGRVEAVVAGEQPAADPVERVGLAASVAQGVVLGAAADLIEGAVGEVGSDRGAVPAFRLVRFPGPSPEPDVRLSPHPALHELVPFGYATSVVVMGPLHGVGITAPR
jgi:hypothetical protein